VAPLNLSPEERRKLLEDLLAGLPEPEGPVHNPVDRFLHLPENTRLFLEELRQDDLDDLRKVLKGFRNTGTVIWFFKWIIITLGTTFMAVVAFGEKFSKALSYLKGQS
jgi:hypothetical protein